MSTARHWKPLRIALRGRQPRLNTKRRDEHEIDIQEDVHTFVALLAVGTIAAMGAARAGGWQDNDDQLSQKDERLAQMAELEKLHAAFHAAVSVHNLSGDSPEVITQRIRDAVALWTKDGVVTVLGTSGTAGNYVGYGDPDDPLSCPEPSGDTSPTGQQGTLCTLFKYVAGGTKEAAANKWVSLTPAYKTKYVPVRDHDGQWKSSVYFECHYFDVSPDTSTGQPLWTAKSHVNLYGEAQKIGGHWLFTHVSSSAVTVPLP